MELDALCFTIMFLFLSNDWNVDKNDDHGSNLNKINCRSLGKMASQNMCLLPNWPPALNHHWSTCKQSLDLQLIISLILSPNFRISKYLKELRKCTHQLTTNDDKNNTHTRTSKQTKNKCFDKIAFVRWMSTIIVFWRSPFKDLFKFT